MVSQTADIDHCSERNATPFVPLEIWATVIGSLVNSTDFPEAWKNCRQVSRAFKAATEYAFQSEGLPMIETSLSLLGCWARGKSTMELLPFSGFSENGERVHFGGYYEGPAPLAKNWAAFGPDHCCFPPSRKISVEYSISDDGFRHPPVLMEWASKLHLSFCCGILSQHQWTEEERRQLRRAWIGSGLGPSMAMEIDHWTRGVSFLWKPMLKKFVKNMDRGLKCSRDASVGRTSRQHTGGFTNVFAIIVVLGVFMHSQGFLFLSITEPGTLVANDIICLVVAVGRGGAL
ncbi:uncharacterized protein BCR38DRAFT_477222 [Pseudomassariella vexata]|uniref:Uncharacterized protein n=1 Tax=Pseudomassariella vexata TaxID=1141098 RepID=A0A1Y2DKB2_9PEZI|nr:uncharacterized protein BCR38DRAFT_477222 [Pseudomassariella vexata]ORY59604.1 hypothetical protein BCR38DRAFT_477222 [Pseudomassariella vexata]